MALAQAIGSRGTGNSRTWGGIALAAASCALVDLATAVGWMRPGVAVVLLTAIVCVQCLREWRVTVVFRQFLGQVAHEVGNPVAVLQHSIEQTLRTGRITSEQADLALSSTRRLVRVARRLQSAMGLPVQPELAASSAATLGHTAKAVRLLIVDDEDDVRAVLQEAAVAHGFEASVASSVAEAMAYVEQGRGVDLILCDLMMPDGGAEAWLDWCKRERPDLVNRTIVITGGPTSAAALALADEDPHRLLFKPFSMADLKRVAASKL